MRNKKEILSKVSITKIENFFESVKDIITDEFIKRFYEIIKFDIKNIKDCSEKYIVEYYIEVAEDLLENEDEYDIENEHFWEDLKSKSRQKLVNKYLPKTSFDNNIDIYFNDVKREYILHPMNESEQLLFVPENKDIFIKNNLKLVIDCAKRYQGFGLPLEDLIQTGNLGLLKAFEKFDMEKGNLQNNIIYSIKKSKSEKFSKDEVAKIVKDNFTYTKLLTSTLMKIPDEGFSSKDDFIDWTLTNIKKASFSSIAFIWIRAAITSSIDKLVNTIHVPKTALDKGFVQPTVIKLDSLNPHTEDNYADNIINEYYSSDEFLVENDSIETVEYNNLFKDLLSDIFIKMDPMDVRIIKKRFGIEYPFEMSLQEIAENEGLSINKVKTSINNSIKFITNNIPVEDKNTLMKWFK